MSPAKPNKPLIPYIRQSRARETQVSLDQQWTAIAAWAKANGRKLAVDSLAAAKKAGLVDHGVSGNKPWKDRALGLIIERCAAGDASGVIAYDRSRLTREGFLGQAEIWEAMTEAGAQFVEATGGVMDRTKFVILGEMARLQWEEAQRRGIDSAIRATREGKRVGPTPVGYLRVNGKLVPDGDPEDPSAPAGIIRCMYQERARGCTDRRLMELLNTLPPSNRGNAAKVRGRSAARNLIASPTYRGLLKWGDVEVHDETMRIVSDTDWQRAQRERKRGVKSKRNDVLGGLVRCHAGHRMSVSSNQNGPQWRCTNDGCAAKARVNFANLDALVIPQLLDHYLGAHEAPRSPEDRTPELEAALEAARADLAEVEALTGIRPAAKAAALSEAMEAVEAAEKELAEYTPAMVGDVPPKAILVKLKEAAERDNAEAVELLRGLAQRAIDHVDVTHGRAPAEQRVTVYWRDGDVTGAKATLPKEVAA